MSGARNPWDRLVRLIFAKDERGDAIPYDPAEVERLTRQIDDGYAKTHGRQHAGRHRERALLLERIGEDRMMREPLTKQFLAECSDVITSAGLQAGTLDAMRMMIRKLRSPRPAPRPFHEPDPAACDFDPDDHM